MLWWSSIASCVLLAFLVPAVYVGLLSARPSIVCAAAVNSLIISQALWLRGPAGMVFAILAATTNTVWLVHEIRVNRRTARELRAAQARLDELLDKAMRPRTSSG